MSAIDDVKLKVQRILTNNLGNIRIDKDGDYIFEYESAITYISVIEGFGDDGVNIQVRCPMIKNVLITNELCRWIATEGQRYVLGGCRLNPNADEKTAWIYFEYGISANDLDESELMDAVLVVTHTGNQLDNMLCDRFGGELFGDE